MATPRGSGVEADSDIGARVSQRKKLFLNNLVVLARFKLSFEALCFLQ
jgi:hypothetical protein